MSLKVYLSLALGTFVAATAGSDLYARTTIGRQRFPEALREHLYWAAVELGGTLLLLAPFVVTALVCARAEKQARPRTTGLIFGLAMLALLYFYFQGHQAAQRAELERMWTAATLSIGLLPFFIGIPVVLAVMAAGALAARFDARATAP